MRENQWLFERNFSKYSLEHINNANTEAETKHQLELDKSIHGKLAFPTQFSILMGSEKPHLFLFTPITHTLRSSLPPAFSLLAHSLYSASASPKLIISPGFQRSLFHALSRYVRPAKCVEEARA